MGRLLNKKFEIIFGPHHWTLTAAFTAIKLPIGRSLSFQFATWYQFNVILDI